MGRGQRSGEENMMHKITLSNNFHNTEITVLTDYDTAGETWYHTQEPVFAGYPTAAQRAKYRRVKNVLCGSDDCQCGTVR